MTPPRLVVVIGANGAGKSTWCRHHREVLPTDFYDADSIAQQIGSYDNPTDQFLARARVNAHIERHFEQFTSFGFESTYSGESRPRMVQRASRLGYESYAIFIGTHDPEINVRRVQARVATRTGHHVDESEIRRRWTAAQENLVKTAPLFDRIRLIDNSEDHSWTVVDYIGRDNPHRDVNAPLWAARLTVALARGRFARGTKPSQ